MCLFGITKCSLMNGFLSEFSKPLLCRSEFLINDSFAVFQILFVLEHRHRNECVKCYT